MYDVLPGQVRSLQPPRQRICEGVRGHGCPHEKREQTEGASPKNMIDVLYGSTS
uniref:AlNc14C19G2029 protein n=1 Tax=Albugo laibachii Nc14 TaxID=890382 RepID=F0W558_9STRA|nr:AlNc14C19G2029 [Albugo laibachii Nc14]|eukprot:CCA16249.1 AlNc14C19G2029 [Albugo laibachii Nc14]